MYIYKIIYVNSLPKIFLNQDSKD